jgi:hypothetical protein
LRRFQQEVSNQPVDEEITYTVEELAQLVIARNRIYLHNTARIYYTSYDLRRNYDTVTSTHPDIMLQSNDDTTVDGASTFWYGRVHLIFHLDIYMTTRQSSHAFQHRRMDVMLVRWFGADPSGPGGAISQRLQRIGYVPGAEEGFGFIDPKDVIRGCHLIPGFFEGVTDSYLFPSMASDQIEGHPLGTDWKYYYVNQ